MKSSAAPVRICDNVKAGNELSLPPRTQNPDVGHSITGTKTAKFKMPMARQRSLNIGLFERLAFLGNSFCIYVGGNLDENESDKT
ncbi:Hypothetical predicted protein [Octopus vulgaris]|uniref:Uncharacterized protein n=1 Tax=Octopus vulgaris TaxID=6645 RepID=A0AA36BT70_OCTVU|nr:Hypothetical predicted protein [Octopus vulgaris]